MKPNDIGKITVANYYRCVWCGQGFNMNEELEWNNHPYECNFFGAILKEIRKSIKKNSLLK